MTDTNETKNSNIIKLNVGGVMYVTTRSTLCQPGSWFETMFSGKMEPGIQIDGAYFIDRDGEMFRYVINYMRNLDKWLPPGDVEILSQLVNEAGFFCLEGMLEKIKKMVPTTYYTFEVYLQMDKYGRCTSIVYSKPPPPSGIKEDIDKLITKGSTSIDPPQYGIVKHLINHLDSHYELYYYYTNSEGVLTLGFKVDPKRIALTDLKRHLEMFK